MANRSSVWDTMYGTEDEEVQTSSQQTAQQTSQITANNRHFLSSQPPFATDEQASTHSPLRSSYAYGGKSFAFETPDLRLPDQHTGRLGGAGTQRSREMFSATELEGGATAESPAKRHKTGSQRHNPLRKLYYASREREQSQVTEKSALRDTVANESSGRTTTTTPSAIAGEGAYSMADLESDMADAAEFAFNNDIQRCQSFIGGFQTSLNICTKNGDAERVVKLATELSKVTDVLNKPS